MFELVCDGPGPHNPVDGILGKSSNPIVVGMRCSSQHCVIHPPQQPLSPAGALAALLAVEGVLTVIDAANAVGLTPEDLTLEAQAWAVAANQP